VKVALCLPLLAALTACSAVPAMGPRAVEPRLIAGSPPAAPVLASGLHERRADAVTLFDSRLIRAARKASDEALMLNLTSGQKIVLWVGVGIVAAYLISEEIEDEVAFFP